jgi:acetyl-CoA carboxylase biotin carboxyl carrier protein
MALDFKEISELLAAIAANNITELTLKNAEFELTVSQSRPVLTNNLTAAESIDLSQPQPISPQTVEQLTPAVNNKPATPTPDKKWVEVTSPMVGTFYRSPAPDEPPFASTGDRIKLGQTVCIIEAMKLMNEIEAESAGQVMEVLVENGQPIEFGQILMYLDPS